MNVLRAKGNFFKKYFLELSGSTVKFPRITVSNVELLGSKKSIYKHNVVSEKITSYFITDW